MTLVSKATTAFGLILLFHACYSAHEVSNLQSYRAASLASLTTSQSGTTTSLPIDITIESIVATFIVCLGMVLGTSRLRPIQWRVWAGQIEREGEAGFKNSSGEVEKDYVGNPFKLLESRPGFIDIIQQRREFDEWAKAKGQ
ncbi:transmembrane protein 32 [Whalleya microplaca]|nr:transmembrane protein 32 [Whalleya microplaca]